MFLIGNNIYFTQKDIWVKRVDFTAYPSVFIRNGLHMVTICYRAGLKILWAHARAGSTPAFGTNNDNGYRAWNKKLIPCFFILTTILTTKNKALFLYYLVQFFCCFNIHVFSNVLIYFLCCVSS